MNLVPWPHDVPDAWDVLTTNGKTMPGVASAKVTGARDIDKPKVPQQNGSNVILKGRKNKDVSLTLKCMRSADWQAFQEHVAMYEPNDKKDQSAALDVQFAYLAARGISAIVVTSLEGPDWDPKGAMTYQVKACEFTRPKPVAKGSASGKAKPPEWEQTAVNGYITTTDKNGNVTYVKKPATTTSDTEKKKPSADPATVGPEGEGDEP